MTNLGHIMLAKGVAVDPSEVQAMLDWPRPRTLTDLRGFLGLTGYYRKFVQGYGQIASPLTEQLKKGCYLWNEEACTTFQQLKTAMTQVPILAMLDFSKPFVIEVDASRFALGAVLMRDDKPVAIHSQVLGLRARQKSAYEKELMAIVFAVLKWRSHLLGRKFFVHTDQKSLNFCLNSERLIQNTKSGFANCWAMILKSIIRFTN